MATPFSDLERTLFGRGGFARRKAHMFEDTEQGGAYAPTPYASWTRLDVWDTGSAFVLWAEVPGLSEGEIQISLKQDVLTLSGERKSDVPEGFQAHRRERATTKFTRSIRLGVKLDADKVTATLKNGILTVTLPKAPEATPRQIQVRSS